MRKSITNNTRMKQVDIHVEQDYPGLTRWHGARSRLFVEVKRWLTISPEPSFARR
jgi:hypothetical protein